MLLRLLYSYPPCPSDHICCPRFWGMGRQGAHAPQTKPRALKAAIARQTARMPGIRTSPPTSPGDSSNPVSQNDPAEAAALSTTDSRGPDEHPMSRNTAQHEFCTFGDQRLCNLSSKHVEYDVQGIYGSRRESGVHLKSRPLLGIKSAHLVANLDNLTATLLKLAAQRASRPS